MATRQHGTSRQSGSKRLREGVKTDGDGEVLREPVGARPRDDIADIWGERAPYVGDWPARPDEHLEAEPDHWVQSCCVLCSNGCTLDIGVKGDKIVGVRGREVDRVNRG